MAFRSWTNHLSGGALALHAVHLPGRGMRMREEPLVSLTDMAAEVVRDIQLHLDSLDLIFFGHSLGSLLCFEVAHALRDLGDQRVVRLILSAHRAPDLPSPRQPVHELPRDQFLESMLGYGGIAPETAKDKELVDLLLPALRGDMTAAETYHYQERKPLRIPLSVIGGTNDAFVTVEEMSGWRRHSSSHGYRERFVPGGHFYLWELWADGFRDLLSQDLGSLLTP